MTNVITFPTPLVGAQARLMPIRQRCFALVLKIREEMAARHYANARTYIADLRKARRYLPLSDQCAGALVPSVPSIPSLPSVPDSK